LLVGVLLLCYWQLGDSNRAMEMAKLFVYPSGYWAKLAAAKAELSEGNISNATFLLAKVTTDFPVSKSQVNEHIDAWRGIDWPLFHTLTKVPKP
jgi:hypothetical protein